METTNLALAGMAGFAGSFHCVVMCGPFAGFVGMRGSSRPLISQVSYQAGRLVAYLGLGILAGSLGRGAFYLGAALNIQRALTLMLGGTMIALGLYRLNPGPKLIGGGLYRRIGRTLTGLHRAGRGSEGAALLGLLSTLLPCGFLYSFAFAAGATAHPLPAAGMMAAFWLGTLPALALVGMAAGRLDQTTWMRIHRLTPIFLILFGILALMGKWTAIPSLSPGDDPTCHPF